MKTSGYGYANYVSFKIKLKGILDWPACLAGWMDGWMDKMFCYCFSLFHCTQYTGQLSVDHHCIVPHCNKGY